jgi:hypothetical protein
MVIQAEVEKARERLATALQADNAAYDVLKALEPEAWTDDIGWAASSPVHGVAPKRERLPSPQYSPTSPYYTPASPSYSPTSPVREPLGGETEAKKVKVEA